jgi:hypothetical protein
MSEEKMRKRQTLPTVSVSDGVLNQSKKSTRNLLSTFSVLFDRIDSLGGRRRISIERKKTNRKNRTHFAHSFTIRGSCLK